MRKFAKYIQRGIESPLQNVKFHGKAPLKRFFMFERKKIKEKGVRIAVHTISKLPKKIPPYCDLHKHDYDEINLVLSEKGTLVYEVQLEDEIYRVKSPATVYIPAGVRHRAEVLSGKGQFIAIIFMGKYIAKK